MKLSVADISLPKNGAVALTVSSKAKLGQEGKELDRLTGDKVTKAMKARGFEGKEGEILKITATKTSARTQPF